MVKYTFVCACIGHCTNCNLEGNAFRLNTLFEVARVGNTNGNCSSIPYLTVSPQTTVGITRQPSRCFPFNCIGVCSITTVDIVAKFDGVIHTRKSCRNCRNVDGMKCIVANDDLLLLTCKNLLGGIAFYINGISAGSESSALVKVIPVFAVFAVSQIVYKIACNLSRQISLRSIDTGEIGSGRTCGNFQILCRTVAVFVGIVSDDLQGFAKPLGVYEYIAGRIFNDFSGNPFTADGVGLSPIKAAKLFALITRDIDFGN